MLPPSCQWGKCGTLNKPLRLNELAHYDCDDNNITKQIPLDVGLRATAYSCCGLVGSHQCSVLWHCSHNTNNITMATLLVHHPGIVLYMDVYLIAWRSTFVVVEPHWCGVVLSWPAASALHRRASELTKHLLLEMMTDSSKLCTKMQKKQ